MVKIHKMTPILKFICNAIFIAIGIYLVIDLIFELKKDDKKKKRK